MPDMSCGARPASCFSASCISKRMSMSCKRRPVKERVANLFRQGAGPHQALNLSLAPVLIRVCFVSTHGALSFAPARLLASKQTEILRQWLLRRRLAILRWVTAFRSGARLDTRFDRSTVLRLGLLFFLSVSLFALFNRPYSLGNLLTGLVKHFLKLDMTFSKGRQSFNQASIDFLCCSCKTQWCGQSLDCFVWNFGDLFFTRIRNRVFPFFVFVQAVRDDI